MGGNSNDVVHSHSSNCAANSSGTTSGTFRSTRKHSTTLVAKGTASACTMPHDAGARDVRGEGRACRIDGRQTPREGNTIFYAQHATASCCRTCIEYWHGIPKNGATPLAGRACRTCRGRSSPTLIERLTGSRRADSVTVPLDRSDSDDGTGMAPTRN